MYRFFFWLIFSRLPPECMHNLGFAGLRALMAIPGIRSLVYRRLRPRAPSLRVSAMGLDFSSPLGLAAGFDKNAVGFEALGTLGFGFVEIGTVTGQAQDGNPKPRMFRLPSDRALINRMGFNNHGCKKVAERLSKRNHSKFKNQLIVGANIGKTKAIADENAIEDYVASAEKLGPVADYLVVNVSSPNTPGLRDLQAVSKLSPLLVAVRSALDRVSPNHRIPLLVKIAPDLADEDIAEVAEMAIALALDGIIATNTTIARTNLHSDPTTIRHIGSGGLSGPPLRTRSLEVLRQLRARVGNHMTLIAAGGIENATDAYERLNAGATLVQAYTAFVYSGPKWPNRLNNELAAKLRHTQ